MWGSGLRGVLRTAGGSDDDAEVAAEWRQHKGELPIHYLVSEINYYYLLFSIFILGLTLYFV